VRRCLAQDDKQTYHLAHALFLAGAVTRSPAEQTAALNMLREMRHAGLAGVVTRVAYVLKLVMLNQAERISHGGSADEVDWIELAQNHSLKIVVMGI